MSLKQKIFREEVLGRGEDSILWKRSQLVSALLDGERREINYFGNRS